LPGSAAIATSALASEAATITGTTCATAIAGTTCAAAITCSSSASYILSSLIGSATKLFP
jgi:hypothetical protein